jgi:hypothetical protein
VIGEGASDCGLMLNLRLGSLAAIYGDTTGANPLTSVSVAAKHGSGGPLRHVREMRLERGS